ncbi:hypothetical protein EJ110_NYTH29355 [Nymphaea thermarum]|nr:hypothetical protein EJ110_NYTH29355 [Nymphaea thermarum]
MVVALGKLTIIVGAGFLGTVLANDGGASKVSDFLSGALKIVFKHLQQDSSTSKSKPKNDMLMAQVDSLRAELQQFASSRSVTVITRNSRSGAQSYTVPVLVIGVVGYGYIWWKGWRLSDLMFASRRSFKDACTTIAKQLDQVSSSVSAAKKYLSSRIDRVDLNLDECAELTAGTRDEISQLRGDVSTFVVDIESVHRAVQCLVLNSSSSVPALESPPVLTSNARAISFSSAKTPALESPSTSEETPKLVRPLHSAASASGLKKSFARPTKFCVVN